ncbi:MAG: acetate kinase [archaeon]
MNFLVINSGSSSLKFSYFQNEDCIISGMCEELGSDRSKLKYEANGKKESLSIPLPSHADAISEIQKHLGDKIDFNKLEVIVHRVVHGGEEFKKPLIINKENLEKLKELNSLAPLHNPPNLLGLEVMMKLVPNAVQIAVFDTAFHSTLPEKAFLYGIPYEFYKKYHIRKFGFHGSSHAFVFSEAKRILNHAPSRVITAHLGNGSSLCAIKDGKSVDTTMGFTPLEGTMMGTRSGTIDPAIVTFLMTKENLSISEVEKTLNKKSGLLGLSELTSDMRILEEQIETHPGAKRAISVFCYHLTKFIGSYCAVLNGLDVLVFTGGIGEKSPIVRKSVCKELTYLGLELDEEKNLKNYGEISTQSSKVKVLVIKTNEELEMVREAKALLKK